MHQGSRLLLCSITLLPIFRAASTVIPLVPKAIFTLSIQPDYGLPRTRPSFTSTINRYKQAIKKYNNNIP